MEIALLVSFVVHTVSAALWTGAVLYAVYAVWPPAMDGGLGVAAFERGVSGVLQTTRWTGLTLPATGAYQTWRLYPLDALTTTRAGWLVVAMAALWGLMNTLVEVGVYRMRTADGESLGVGAYMAEGFVADGGVDVARRARIGWPYLVASAVCAVLLLVDAGLLAAGVV